MVQCEQIHQVDADLIRRFAAVCIQRGQELQFFLPVKKADRGVGVAYINGQQHMDSPSRF